MKNLIITILTLAFISFGCDKCNLPAQNPLTQPENIGDGLETGTPEEVGLNPGCLASAVDDIRNGRYTEVHSMLIYKNDKLVVEEYFKGHRYQWDQPNHHGEYIQWNKNETHDICSAAKSLVSALIGIAIDKGYIESVEQSIFDYLPDHQNLKVDNREYITIENLLTMTAGLSWPEWSAPYSSMDNPTIGIWFSEIDPITYVLGHPWEAEPGSKFNYSSGNMIVLGEIIKNASGMPFEDFSKKYLFDPLQIEDFNWHQVFSNGVNATFIKINPRAMVKIGATFLNGGIWNGQRIVSEEWVQKSTTPWGPNQGINVPGEASGKMGYGYNWWTKTYNHNGEDIHFYTASGFGGQHIMVLPEVDMVVVFTSGNFVTKRPNFKILEKYILESID